MAATRSLVESTIQSTNATDREGIHVPQRLTIGTGHSVTTHMLPREGIVTIGRAPEASIRIEDASVSRVHVRLHVGPVVRVEDLGSANGTRIGGERLAAREPTVLPAGQMVEIGRSWMMIVNAPLSRSSTRQLPEDERDDQPTGPRVASGADEGLVIQDHGMVTLHRLTERAALSDITVLLLGETGVGKEVFARRIHALSSRARNPFVGLNCAAVSPSLFESELFGHERGAFTGAEQTKLGLLESADGGTVLLDEVGDMPLGVQVKLLRVLEERQVLRLGGTRPRAIDVRVLSATNRNLEADVEAGTFRRDLFFRLNSITIRIPPLRERSQEIEPMARRFAAQAAERLGMRGPDFDPLVWERLRQYRWPGNVRQLRNVIERAVVLAEGGRITLDVIPAEGQTGSAPQPAGGELDDERRRIEEALDLCAGNQTRAAELLGISRRTLTKRLAEYDMPRPRKRREG